MSTIPEMPVVVFTTPRNLPAASSLAGRVAVLDIAFTADGMGTPFEEMTGPFIAELGSRLAAWIDRDAANLEEGLRRGYSGHHDGVEAEIKQIDALIAAPWDQWPTTTFRLMRRREQMKPNSRSP